MALVRWDPFREIASLQERMNRLFEEGVFPFRGLGERTAMRQWAPPVDIYETEKEIVLKAELPGMSQDDFSVEVRDNTLTLKGERKQEKEAREEGYYQMERCYGAFQRSFTLPNTVQQDKAKARYKDGVLEVVLPKVETVVPKQIPVEVEKV
ncbi:MAG: Hsp20/alpha crystallin family protein [Nitrospinae bacterium]|nr:Hsp20/alpha crystallin family protein [Nitrospinota bacterium]